MKKFKKILTAATSSLLCLSSLTALSSNAFAFYPILGDEKAIEKRLCKGNSCFFSADNVTFVKEGVFAEENSIFCFSDNRYACYLSAHKCMLTLKGNLYGDNFKRLEEIVHSYYPDFVIKYDNYGYLDVYDYDAAPFDGILDTVEDAEELYKAISEEIPLEYFEFCGGLDPEFGEIGGFSLEYSTYNDIWFDIEAVLQGYIDENDYDMEIVKGEYGKTDVYYLEPNSKMTSQEVAQLYMNIYSDLGLKVQFEPDCREMGFGGTSINLCKTDGDSNTDGVLGIADATLILQYITNKDEYSLTDQGVYNADLDKDGITANDALVIQQMLAERGEV